MLNKIKCWIVNYTCSYYICRMHARSRVAAADKPTPALNKDFIFEALHRAGRRCPMFRSKLYNMLVLRFICAYTSYDVRFIKCIGTRLLSRGSNFPASIVARLSILNVYLVPIKLSLTLAIIV